MLSNQFCHAQSGDSALPLPMDRAEAPHGDDIFEDAFVGHDTRRMLVITSMVGAGIWTVILQLIF